MEHCKVNVDNASETPREAIEDEGNCNANALTSNPAELSSDLPHQYKPRLIAAFDPT
jgi:hypothetical protein